LTTHILLTTLKYSLSVFDTGLTTCSDCISSWPWNFHQNRSTLKGIIPASEISGSTGNGTSPASEISGSTETYRIRSKWHFDHPLRVSVQSEHIEISKKTTENHAFFGKKKRAPICTKLTESGRNCSSTILCEFQ
jgi:hypothetical protein